LPALRRAGLIGRMRFTSLCLFMARCIVPLRLWACEIALVLAVDVSGSVDAKEYDLQMRGLALALRDGAVSEALVSSRAQVALVQWTGSSRQQVALPWREIRSFADTEALAVAVTEAPRAWRHFSTAIGEALRASAKLFDQVPQCARHVIDLSGDGYSNEGPNPASIKPALVAQGITVNALAIEGAVDDLTAYFFENVIVGHGAFVATAKGYPDYPDRIRQKLLRELVEQTAVTKPDLGR
jgi:Ca-activated chloride channel family protein